MKNLSDYAWRGAVVALVALMAVGASGCRRRAVARDARRMARYEQNLLRLAARDTGCHQSQLSPVMISQEPGVYSVTGCAHPVEYWLRCGRRGRRCSWRQVATLNEQAAGMLGCAPQMIQQQPTQMPNQRFAMGCGRQAAFAIQCNGDACGWAMVGPVQQVGGVGPAVVAVQPGVQPGPSVQVTSPAAPPGDVNLAVQQQREAILSCIDVPSVTLTLRWTADGTVQVQLPPELVGTVAEGCIQAAIGTLRIAAQQAGQITVPVQ